MAIIDQSVQITCINIGMPSCQSWIHLFLAHLVLSSQWNGMCTIWQRWQRFSHHWQTSRIKFPGSQREYSKRLDFRIGLLNLSHEFLQNHKLHKLVTKQWMHKASIMPIDHHLQWTWFDQTTLIVQKSI